MALLSLVAFLGTGLAVDAAATGAVLVALGLVGAILVPLRRRIRQRSWASAGASLDFANSVSELGALGLEMQTFGVRHRFAERIDELNHETTDTQRRVQTLTGSLAPIYLALAYAAVLAGVGVLMVVGSEDLAVIGAVILLMLRSLSYGQQLASAAGSIAANAPFLDRIHDTVQRYNASPAATGDIIPAAVTPLVARDVDFEYLAGRPALSGVSFRIDTGDVVGVIGPSGAGKSTLAQLLLGLLEPVRGSLQAGEVDLRDVDRDWWSRRIAFVAQDAVLFTGTVAENIRFFRDGISDAAVRRAATPGQRPRPTSRRFPTASTATSASAAASSRAGSDNGCPSPGRSPGTPSSSCSTSPPRLWTARARRSSATPWAACTGKVTVVIIAHRMSTLEICDRIMVIEGGRMTAFSSPSALREDSDFYQNAMAVAGISAGPESLGRAAPVRHRLPRTRRRRDLPRGNGARARRPGRRPPRAAPRGPARPGAAAGGSGSRGPSHATSGGGAARATSGRSCEVARRGLADPGPHHALRGGRRGTRRRPACSGSRLRPASSTTRTARRTTPRSNPAKLHAARTLDAATARFATSLPRHLGAPSPTPSPPGCGIARGTGRRSSRAAATPGRSPSGRQRPRTAPDG